MIIINRMLRGVDVRGVSEKQNIKEERVKSSGNSNPGKTLFASLVVLCLLPLGILYPEVTKEELVVPDSGMIQSLTLIDGSTILGRITQVKDDGVLFETELGILNIPLDKVVSIEEKSKSAVRKKAQWFPNPNTARLFFAPTGRPLDKRELYLVDYYLFVPMVSYGVTRSFSLSGGISLVPFAGFENQFIYLVPKLGFNLGSDLALSVGALAAKQLYTFEDYPFPDLSLLFSTMTYGKPDLSLTGGIAYGFWEDEPIEAPVLMLGGEVRVAKGVSLITENYLIPNYGDYAPVFSYGARFMGKSFSLDAAFVLPLFDSDFGEFFPGLPFISIAYNF